MRIILAHLVAPALGPLLSLRFETPLHTLPFFVANHAVIVSYLAGLVKRRSTSPLLIVRGAAWEKESSTR